MREVASRRPGEGPPPGERPEAVPKAAARAAGAGGKASLRKFLLNFYSNRKYLKPEKKTVHTKKPKIIA